MKSLSGAISKLEQTIPIAMMGVLALVSFSLLKSTSTTTQNFASSTSAQTDYFLNEFSSAQLYEFGKLNSFIRGRYAEHNLASKNTHVSGFLFASVSKKNRYLGQSDLADFHDDSNHFALHQNAIIERIPLSDKSLEIPSRLKGNHLSFTQYPERVLSESPVFVEQGNRKIFARSMQYYSEEQVMKLTGQVKIQIPPKNSD